MNNALINQTMLMLVMGTAMIKLTTQNATMMGETVWTVLGIVVLVK